MYNYKNNASSGHHVDQVYGLPQSHCVISGRAQCFHDYIYITPTLLL